MNEIYLNTNVKNRIKILNVIDDFKKKMKFSFYRKQLTSLASN